MIQRRLYDLLTAGLKAFADDPSMYDVVFGQYLGLDDPEVAGVKRYFKAKPIRVQHGYQHGDIRPPLVAIILQAESQSQKVLGDAAYLPMGHASNRSIGAGSLWQNSYQLMCYAENIDGACYIYELVKAIFICSHGAMAKLGIIDPSYTGQDLAPDPRYLPENLFVRVLGVSAQSTYVLPELLSRSPLGVAIEGLFVEAGTSRAPEPYRSGVTSF